MKIAFASDFHFGFGDDALAQAAEALRQACSEADLVVLAGDLFDSRVPKQEVVYDAVRLLSEAKAVLEAKATVSGLKLRLLRDGTETRQTVPIVAIYGTHERRTKGLVNIIQVLDSAGLVLNCHAGVVAADLNGERVAIQGMGGVPEEYAKQVLDAIEFKPLPESFDVFVFHQTLRELIPAVAEGIAAADLPKGFDLYVDGHIHWARELNEGGKRILLPGSTVVTQMKKSEASPKGFYVCDSLSKEVVFKEIRVRPFVYAEVEFKDAWPEEVIAACRLKLEEIALKQAGRKPLVKLKLKGSLAQRLSTSAVDLTALEKEFGERMLLTLDRDFEGADLKERIEALRKKRGETTGARGAGAALLRERLKERQSPWAEDEQLFALLAEKESEAALKHLLAREI
ncbi:TPA: hypothetical protein HA318_04765 [Candidatus Micrarchaeota archaeon]|nr:MAG: hypothetical protein AUJ65_04970 [Candidatus Micrarchaeota archaeon CG1_02_51_15]HII39284.1 hypothetical protein [Candidatus Micrarchaeota archaeon]